MLDSLKWKRIKKSFAHLYLLTDFLFFFFPFFFELLKLLVLVDEYDYFVNQALSANQVLSKDSHEEDKSFWKMLGIFKDFFGRLKDACGKSHTRVFFDRSDPNVAA